MFASLTSLVEIDLIRANERMPVVGVRPASDYEVLVSRSWQRPIAHLIVFGVRDPMPELPVPLREGEDEPLVDLGGLLRALHDRAGYDLRIDYRRAPVPPLDGQDATWAQALLVR